MVRRAQRRRHRAPPDPRGGALRILFLTQTFPRFAGDTAGPFIREIALGLVRLGDQVTVLTPHAPGLPPGWHDAGLEVKTFRYAPERFESLGYSRSLAADETIRGGAGLVAPFYALALRRAASSELAARHYDLVHAHWLVPNAVALAAMALGPPLAVGLHGSDVFLAERQPFRAAARLALAGTRLLTGCSPELVDRVCTVGFSRARSRVIPYGVDPEVFSPDPARRGIWRERLGVPLEAPLLLGVGRMVTKKGFDVLLEILPRLLEHYPDLHVVLAGEGDRLAGYRAQCAALKIPHHAARVHFPGAVLRDTLPDLFRAADVFVLPAVHDAHGNVDGLPNVILEAMASGLPVVASAISGIPLAVADGETGWLVPEAEPLALMRALDLALADPDRSARLGRAARTRAATQLTWDAVAAQYRQAYRDVALAPAT